MVQLLSPEVLRHKAGCAVLQVVEGGHPPKGGRAHGATTVGGSIDVIIKHIQLQRRTRRAVYVSSVHQHHHFTVPPSSLATLYAQGYKHHHTALIVM